MVTSKEDEDFWFDAVKDVPSYRSNDKVTHIKKPKIKINPKQSYAIKQDFSTNSKALDEYDGGIDKATLRRFKREEYEIEAVLDLHGLNEDKAYDKVNDFIVKNYNQSKRCIIIITGKGNTHQDDDVFAQHGILRKSVPQWLNAPNLRSMILIYKHPSERLGGSGALYILLKRNKECC